MVAELQTAKLQDEKNVADPATDGFLGATRRIRTDDLLITNQLLYQLS